MRSHCKENNYVLMFVDTFEKVGIKVRVFSITDRNYPKVFSISNTLKNIMVKYIWIIKRDVERARNKGEPITYRKTS